MKVYGSDGVEKLANQSGTDVQVNTGGNLSAADLQDTASVTWSEAAGVVTATAVGSNATAVITVVRKGSVGTINKGQPVYISGYNVGGWTEVELADANDPAAMPCIGIANESITNSSDANVVVAGQVDGFDTSSWADGDELFVSTTAGVLTNTRPSGVSDAVQKVAIVKFSNVATGVIEVVSAGRANDVPNLEDAKFWVGNGSNVATAVAMSTDATMANTGAVTIAAGAVGNTKLADMAAYTIKARNNAGSGDPEDVDASVIAEDATPTSGNKLLGFASGGANAALQLYDIGNLPAGGEINALVADGISGIADDQLAVGTGAGTAAYLTLSTAGVVSFNGTSFSQGALAGLSDVTGTTGTGSTLVFDTSPTIVTPTIASFANAAHDHTNAAGGAQLDHTTALTNIGSNSHTAIDNHISGTTEHGATGAVMGTTNTQSPTNKDLTDQTNKLHWSKGITLESPADGERFAIYMNERAVTITGISFSGEGGTSVLFNIEYAATVASGTVIHTDTATISTPEWDVTPSGTTAVPTNQIILLEITTVTGTVNQLHVTIEGDHT